jgi:peptidoglycan/xylan/chitin deacetylase (PgdA/CDA1 family)
MAENGPVTLVSVQGSLRQRLARRAPTVVLMYHRVGPEERDLQKLRVRDDHFDAHLTTIQKYADVVPLTEVLAPARRPRVAITFDDGYADNLHVAEPLLAKHDAPGTVFVTAAVVESGEGFWQDRLAAMVLDGDYAVAQIEVDIAGEHVTANVQGAEAREQAYRAVHKRTRRRTPEEIERVLTSVAGQLGVRVADHAGAIPATLTPDQVKELASSPVVTIGSHTLRHPFLSALDEAEQRSEIVESRARLEALIGEPVTTFAYPFGTADAFDRTSVQLAQDAGYEISVTGVPARITRFTRAQQVPRRFVGDWNTETFDRKLRTWLDQ